VRHPILRQKIEDARFCNPFATDQEIAAQVGCSEVYVSKVRLAANPNRRNLPPADPHMKFMNLITSARALLFQAAEMCRPEVKVQMLARLDVQLPEEPKQDLEALI